jgi:hypothetical protein
MVGLPVLRFQSSQPSGPLAVACQCAQAQRNMEVCNAARKRSSLRRVALCMLSPLRARGKPLAATAVGGASITAPAIVGHPRAAPALVFCCSILGAGADVIEVKHDRCDRGR